ncbi:MAG: amidohydrolase [Chlorobi bacterium]|nr:amidohydrolase [Chlorobiota bacterium]
MRKILFAAGLLSLINACDVKKENADLILLNGVVYTVNSDMDIAEAVAVKDGIIVAVGANEEVGNRYTSENIINLKGKSVYPGFIDAHCHFYGYGVDQLIYADLTGTKSFDEVLSVLKEFSEKNKNNKWILGRGWDQNDWPDKIFPDNRNLNELFPDKPVVITRIDGHAVLVNKKALDAAGFNEKTIIPGGKLQKKNGELTGILLDNAADKLKEIVPPLNDAMISEALLGAQEDCFTVGLTSVVDAGLDKNVVEIIDSLNKEGKLKMRIYAMLTPDKETVNTYVKKGIYKTPYLHISSIKLYADGALGSRGACLLQPYYDDPGNFGFLVNTPEYLDSLCAVAFENGYQVNTHAIGDSAVRTVLNIYRKYLKPDNDRRWRIEHSQVVAPEDFALYGKINVIPAVNTTHATSDMYWAEERLGPERIKNAYAYKKLLQQNGWLTNGSDFPVESINPLYGFYAAVARKDLSGYPEGGFQPENALTREQALKAMTIWAAKGSFEEDEKGSIEPGKIADMVVTDRDIMKCEIADVPETNVIYTFSGGKPVFEKNITRK